MTDKPTAGRREQRKIDIRRAIVLSAHNLFAKRGFNSVTVAEIAKSADVSVKTLFTYFDSKEDIVFDEEMELITGIVDKLRLRRKGTSVFNEFRKCIISFLENQAGRTFLDELEGFERMTENPVLKSRLQMMWLKYEAIVCDFLIVETSAKADDPRPRLASIQMVALIRLLIGPEAKIHAAMSEKGHIQKWFASAAKFLTHDFAKYAIKK